MLQLGFRAAKRFALGSVLVALGVVGCTAGVQPTHLTGAGGGGGNALGLGGLIATGLGGFNIGGSGGSTTGTGGTLPVPPGCGDGINNQGGIEALRRRQHDGRRRLQRRLPGRAELDLPAGRRLHAHRSAAATASSIPGEVCDDGNTTDGDGCNATCTVQDGRYTCMPGKPCVLHLDLRQQARRAGRELRRRQRDGGDGCSATCAARERLGLPGPRLAVHEGPALRRRHRPGQPWARCATTATPPTATAARPTARSRAPAAPACPGQKCVCPRSCAATASSRERRSATTATPTAATAARRPARSRAGYVCPLRKAPCVPDCGDGIVIGTEPCDRRSITDMKRACSATCRWNPGWACTGSPATRVPRHQVRRRQEGRRRGLRRRQHRAVRRLLGHLPVPSRPARERHGRRCTGKCGDGIVLSGEACDDGNNLSGDGCSATCTVESGLHLHAAAARRQDPGAGRLPRLQVTTRPATSNRARPARWRSSPGSSARCWARHGKPVFVAANGLRVHRERRHVRRVVHDVSGVEPHHRHDADALEQRPGRLRQPLGSERRAVDHVQRPDLV